mgnify:CR=1 FL=1
MQVKMTVFFQTLDLEIRGIKIITHKACEVSKCRPKRKEQLYTGSPTVRKKYSGHKKFLVGEYYIWELSF